MITFRVGERAKDCADVASVEWDGRQFSREATRGSVTMGLARELVAAGCPDQPWQAVDAVTGSRRFYGGSLHRLSGLTITEGDRAGLRIEKYVPFQHRGATASGFQAEGASEHTPETASP